MTTMTRVAPQAVLAEFVEYHPGVRAGRLFGRPAAFAGRRAFAVVQARRLAIRLPPTIGQPGPRLDPRPGSWRDVRRRRSGGNLDAAGRRRTRTEWVHCRVPATDARLELVAWLEVAARYAAERSSLGSTRQP